MERVEVELFTDGGNDAVLRIPGRRFPGVLIQGDPLAILRTEVAELSALCARGAMDDARESADLLLADLDVLLQRYTEALDVHGIPRPF